MCPDLALLSTIIGSNYSYLELIFMVPKVFEPLKFSYIWDCLGRKKLIKKTFGILWLTSQCPGRVVINTAECQNFGGIRSLIVLKLMYLIFNVAQFLMVHVYKPIILRYIIKIYHFISPLNKLKNWHNMCPLSNITFDIFTES